MIGRIKGAVRSNQSEYVLFACFGLLLFLLQIGNGVYVQYKTTGTFLPSLETFVLAVATCALIFVVLTCYLATNTYFHKKKSHEPIFTSDHQPRETCRSSTCCNSFILGVYPDSANRL
jgi:hypothetical protein